MGSLFIAMCFHAVLNTTAVNLTRANWWDFGDLTAVQIYLDHSGNIRADGLCNPCYCHEQCFDSQQDCRAMKVAGCNLQMAVTIQLHQRPHGQVADEIVEVTNLLTDQWFTGNVPEDTRRDLLFQDAFCLYEDGRLRASSGLHKLEWNDSYHFDGHPP